MATFFCKLTPPRPTFALDMTPGEAKLMQEHAEYWQRGRLSGHVRAYGLVADPAGPYGVGIVDFHDEAGARAFTDGDPVSVAKGGFRYDVFLMPMGA
jgi:hypothetical protein